jgi:hypothetical protein
MLMPLCINAYWPDYKMIVKVEMFALGTNGEWTWKVRAPRGG